MITKGDKETLLKEVSKLIQQYEGGNDNCSNDVHCEIAFFEGQGFRDNISFIFNGETFDRYTGTN